MKVLIVGRGGREHAIAWKVKESKRVKEVFVAPGNPGMVGTKLVNIDELDISGLVDYAKKNEIDLTIVGPESSLVNGIVDAFNKEGLKIFGPTRKASIIEGSKQYAKDLMRKHNIPTASYNTFANYDMAIDYVKNAGVPIVIKYDGLAAGKGVVVAFSIDEANDALKDMLKNAKYGEGKVVIEEYLEGPEFSLMAFVNGNSVYPMEIAQDHKRAFEGDLGPNTGGMGAYSPVPLIPDSVVKEAIEKIMIPAAKAMVVDNRCFTGILYGGLILTKKGPKVIEFNARFGDPETEVVLPRLKNDLIDVILDVMDDVDPSLSWSREGTLGVVLASKGYPGSYETGHEIKGLSDNSMIFHMGTSFDGTYKTNGGRVLFVVGKGDTITKAQINAYDTISNIKCDNLYYRKDIGYQVIK
ncbi:phosphoribosylamine--glycine ligase [Mycoplasmatota bacterium zrk1]